jgi:hypothetical protein
MTPTLFFDILEPLTLEFFDSPSYFTVLGETEAGSAAEQPAEG